MVGITHFNNLDHVTHSLSSLILWAFPKHPVMLDMLGKGHSKNKKVCKEHTNIHTKLMAACPLSLWLGVSRQWLFISNTSQINSKSIADLFNACTPLRAEQHTKQQRLLLLWKAHRYVFLQCTLGFGILQPSHILRYYDQRVPHLQNEQRVLHW